MWGLHKRSQFFKVLLPNNVTYTAWRKQGENSWEGNINELSISSTAQNSHTFPPHKTVYSVTNWTLTWPVILYFHRHSIHITSDLNNDNHPVQYSNKSGMYLPCRAVQHQCFFTVLKAPEISNKHFPLPNLYQKDDLWTIIYSCHVAKFTYSKIPFSKSLKITVKLNQLQIISNF